MKTLLKHGVVCGKTAFNIYKGEKHILDSIQLKIDFKKVKHIKFHRLSNCKIKTTINNIKFILYDNCTISSSKIQIFIHERLHTINIENIINVAIDVYLEPLLNLRNCKDINEALMCWSLNGYFNTNLPSLENHNLDFNVLKDKICWFLNHKTINNLVPKKFINMVKKTPYTFLSTLFKINKYFMDKVQKYHNKNNIRNLTQFNFMFNIELYGKKEELFNDSLHRKSLMMVGNNNKDYLHLKSFAILYNLRWFFNTVYNDKKPLGLDGEYGCSTVNGKYGQTFHKYDDVILWLITHPNTIEEVEFVVVDPIPKNFIFNSCIK
jgi:hypothetical protein